MNERNESLSPDWSRRVAAARRDQPPALDPAPLLRALRAEPLGPAHTLASPGWWPEFAGLFGSRPLLTGLAVATLVVGSVVAWQAAVAWNDVIPWADFMAGDESGWIGGAL